MKKLKTYLISCLVINLLLTFSTTFFDSEICYTCDAITLFLIFVLHIILIISTLSNNRLIFLLVLILFVFYTSRIPVIQFLPESYGYPEISLTPDDMRESIFVLLLISFGLLLGCLASYRIGGIRKYLLPFRVFPFEKKINNLKSFYYLVIIFFIITTVIRLILIFKTGVGLPISVEFFSPISRRVLKAASFFTFLGISPFIWFVIKRPTGIERRLTIFAIMLYLLSVAVTLSKAGIISGILPLFLFYYITGQRIPSRIWFYMKIVLFTALPFFVVTQSLRTMVSVLYTDKVSINIFDAVSNISISSLLLNPLSRIWSSFDVLTAVIKTRANFLPFLNFYDELLDIVNGYIPGGVFETNAPQFTQLLHTILHGTSYDYMLLTRTGENITIPGYLYVYWGTLGAAAVSFILMLFLGLVFRYTNSLFLKVIVCQLIIGEITNGSGIFGPFVSIFMSFAVMYFFIILYKMLNMYSRFLDKTRAMDGGSSSAVVPKNWTI